MVLDVSHPKEPELPRRGVLTCPCNISIRLEAIASKLEAIATIRFNTCRRVVLTTCPFAMATAPPELWTFVLAPVCRPSELHLWVAFALWAAKALELHLLRFWLAIRLPRLKTTGAVPPARARPEGCSGQSGEHSKTGKGMPFVHTDCTSSLLSSLNRFCGRIAARNSTCR